MAQPKVSVVVPMYKVEKYVERCLKSIQAQTFEDYEVLMINDGSPDKSAAIAQTFADKDPRFVLYNKENGGLSDARNYGLERAKGEFIVFIDSDDYLHKDYLNVMYHECVDNGADMSYCRYNYVLFDSCFYIPIFFSAGKEVMKTRDALNILIRDNYLQSFAWNKMYRRSLFIDNDIRYPDMYFEDIATSGRVLYHANKLAITDKYLYFYVMRMGSIMTTMNAKKINDYMRSMIIVRNHIQEKGLYEEYKKSVRSMAAKMRFVNIYSIFRQHIINFDFRKLIYNLRINNSAYKYITSDKYISMDGLPDIPYKIHQPGWEKKK